MNESIPTNTTATPDLAKQLQQAAAEAGATEVSAADTQAAAKIMATSEADIHKLAQEATKANEGLTIDHDTGLVMRPESNPGH